MQVPLNWLREYVSIDLPLKQLADKLTLGGLEVEGIKRIGDEWAVDKIFVGQVVSVRAHPQADRLVLVTVDYGQGEPLEVVTGAPNLHVGDQGQKVVFAIAGARLIDGHSETLRYQVLKRNKIRGIESAGMVCSEKELGISEEHAGIVILPEDAPVGKTLVDYWGDVILDIKIEPNMARCLSMIGIAREVAALTGQALRLPVPQAAFTGEPIHGQIKVAIADPALCSRYSAALIKGVTIKPSPQWMQRRLTLAGMRPINNIVDITNYVMLEWGQPLHAFDYRRLRPLPGEHEPAIIVRRAGSGETMPTLDGSTRSFSDDMLMITDGAGAVAVAGVMGGLTSEVTEQTTDILLEAANFSFISIRRTSTALKLPSEAAYRFGRGVDPELTLVALQRATELMGDLAGGITAYGYEDVYPGVRSPQVIDLPTSEVKRLLGIDLDASHIARLLGSLGFSCEVLDQAQPCVRTTVPSYRLDVTIPADLVEEVARLYGYDALPCTLIADEMPGQKGNLDLSLEERIRDLLVGCGLNEAISYSLTNLESVARLVPGGAMPEAGAYLRLTNPLSHDCEYLRQTLMNTTLETMASNLRFVDRVAVFEIANIYLPQDDQILPKQPRRLSIGMTGAREVRSWLSNEGPTVDFYDLKGVVETLCARLGVVVKVEPTKNVTFYPGRVASIQLGDTSIGVFGEVHPLVCAAFNLPAQSVCLLELDLDALIAAAQPNVLFMPISRMPEVREDLALVVAEDVHSDDIARTIREAGGALLVDVVLFDVYRGKQLGEGRKSLAYSLTFQADDRTLTTEQTAKLRAKIVQQVEIKYKAQLRA
ncbi:MAG: phenylalanine--tRNA ligase subunit beta [Anaerolineae bacterium]